jgi:DNA-binding NtrC family response regulator
MKKNWPILVVDDEDVMCESMGAWLREDGYHVDTASNGQKALVLAKSMDYAICFVDLKMPGGMDGIDGSPSHSAGSIHHYHHCVRNRGHGDPGYEGRCAGIHREAL